MYLEGQGGAQYHWSGPAGFTSALPTVSLTAIGPYQAGVYTLNAQDAAGCTGRATASITVNKRPAGSLLSGKSSACIPFVSDFKFHSPVSSISSEWRLNDKVFAGKSFSLSFAEAGSYTITGRYADTLTGCGATGSFVVNAFGPPVADFGFAPEKPVEGLDEVMFTNTSSGGQQKAWNWYFIKNSGAHFQNENTSFLFGQAGIYPVALVVTNAWGCADTIVKSIEIEEDFSMYVPNAFTPNGDGRNEIFIPVMRGVKLYELSVFDRWGELVFLTNDQLAGWDGTFKGETCKMDTYVWKIKLSTNSGKMKSLSGHVMLDR